MKFLQVGINMISEFILLFDNLLLKIFEDIETDGKDVFGGEYKGRQYYKYSINRRY